MYLLQGVTLRSNHKPTLFKKKALLLEMSCNNKNVIGFVINRSPSQSTDEFDSFLSNLENFLRKLICNYWRL